ncbi:hypothetical protein BJV77DRAFT_777845 [Russula vinacea]|nr:hypothetical protein BJV77DRAFT_777845 [Russula vinacea]
MTSRHNRHTVCPPKRRENMQNNEHKVTREFSRLSRRDIQYTGGLVCQRREPFRIVYSGANTQYSHFQTSPKSKMEVVKETLNVAGDHPPKPSTPLTRAAFEWVAEKQASSKQSPRDFIVVMFDQRNHDRRTVDGRGNLGWSSKAEEHNERHAVDMYGMLVGTVKDLSFLMDVLPA